MKLGLLAITIALIACVPPSTGGYYGPGQTPQYASTEPTSDPAQARAIAINHAPLGPSQGATLEQLEASAGVRLPDGEYWYDATSGAFGAWGQPLAVLIGPGLDLGPPVPADASHGDSGVFVNGRELQRSEVAYLVTLLDSPLQPGRYFIDSSGNAGVEGGPVLVNLVAAAQARTRSNGAASGNAAGGKHIHAGSGSNQSWFDSDGKCKVFMTSKGDSIMSGC